MALVAMCAGRPPPPPTPTHCEVAALPRGKEQLLDNGWGWGEGEGGDAFRGTKCWRCIRFRSVGCSGLLLVFQQVNGLRASSINYDKPGKESNLPAMKVLPAGLEPATYGS